MKWDFYLISWTEISFHGPANSNSLQFATAIHVVGNDMSIQGNTETENTISHPNVETLNLFKDEKEKEDLWHSFIRVWWKYTTSIAIIPHLQHNFFDNCQVSAWLSFLISSVHRIGAAFHHPYKQLTSPAPRTHIILCRAYKIQIYSFFSFLKLYFICLFLMLSIINMFFLLCLWVVTW